MSFFFQTATENLRCCSTTSTMPCKTSQQGRVEMERVWNLQLSEFVNPNGAKMVDVWNKLTEPRTRMEVGKLLTRAAQWLSWCHQTKSERMQRSLYCTDFGISIWNMEYVIHNMSLLIPCQQPPNSNITINFWTTKTASPRS